MPKNGDSSIWIVILPIIAKYSLTCEYDMRGPFIMSIFSSKYSQLRSCFVDLIAVSINIQTDFKSDAPFNRY